MSNNESGEEIQEHYWHVNPGDEKIHAVRMKGRFRNYKWMTAALYLFFFFGPYLRWDGRQAVLFDIPARKFHIFSLTIWPQDVWMLSLLLLFLALLLFATTAVAGRVFCGYFCFQTVWTDIFTLIETWLEGSPAKRQKLDKAPLSLHKIAIKLTKHFLWIAVGVLTGITFAAYFADAFWLWKGFLTLSAPAAAWWTLLFFVLCSYLFAGFLREQVCFWLCPYARIQGVMYDSDTILPTYDEKRGEPRARLHKGRQAEGQGDCIDCNLCHAVCPTGIDIRNGQQEGCITCGLCIDACDSVMLKISRPFGLIRYASMDEMEGRALPPLFKRPRVVIYSLILLLALSGIIYGFMNLGGLSINLLHERQPIFVKLSDGSIQNKYIMKIVNTSDHELNLKIEVEGGDEMILVGAEDRVKVPLSRVKGIPLFLRIKRDKLDREILPVKFKVSDLDDETMTSEYESMFMGPKP
ncbi:MAG: cytochrome c oxidase accessory protein CcoG [bacterium]|nr:cytochrome c oxidase accessory protein CcoG [bacterium]